MDSIECNPSGFISIFKNDMIYVVVNCTNKFTSKSNTILVQMCCYIGFWGFKEQDMKGFKKKQGGNEDPRLWHQWKPNWNWRSAIATPIKVKLRLKLKTNYSQFASCSESGIRFPPLFKVDQILFCIIGISFIMLTTCFLKIDIPVNKVSIAFSCWEVIVKFFLPFSWTGSAFTIWIGFRFPFFLSDFIFLISDFQLTRCRCLLTLFHSNILLKFAPNFHSNRRGIESIQIPKLCKKNMFSLTGKTYEYDLA